MNIRIATRLDRDEIQGVYLSAFSESEREMVSKLAVNLLSEDTSPQTYSYVAETEGAVVGHVALSPILMDDHEHWHGYILAPLAVKPDYQKRGIGSKLIERGMQQLLKMGAHILFVYGDPTFYGRFGFRADAADRYTPPFSLQYPYGWQAITLNEYHLEKSPIKITCVPSLCAPELW